LLLFFKKEELSVRLPEEFRVIARHFAGLAGPEGLGLLDDAAVFAPPAGRELVVSADCIVEGVHFLPGDPPETVGRKLLRVNLSDLAAMGAVPLHYLLTVSVPRETPAAWFAAFVAGLAGDQREFGISLIGGDTTSTPGPISLSATVIGHVAPGAALRRAGLWVTGTIGDGALGLLAARGEIADPDLYLSERYRLPRPRLGLRLAGIVNAAMDVSDGLVQDAGHLCRAAGLGAVIEVARLPLSAAARDARRLDVCLSGGDDYELLLAVPAANEAALQAECRRAAIPMTRIGRFDARVEGVRVVDAAGAEIVLPLGGWSHFQLRS
jgi:thiamine-monophosphate kinase